MLSLALCILIIISSFVTTARGRGAPPIHHWSDDALFHLEPGAPIYLGSEQWARVMTPVSASQAPVFTAALWEGTRLSRRRLEQMGRFQDREVWGSVQIYQWGAQYVGPRLMENLGFSQTHVPILGLYMHLRSNFSTIVVTGKEDNETLWATLIHEIAHHWYASAWRRGPYRAESTEAFARSVEQDALPLWAWQRLPLSMRYRPHPPRVTVPVAPGAAHGASVVVCPPGGSKEP